MIDWSITYLYAFILSILIGSALLFIVAKFAYNHNLFDNNNNRKIHIDKIPRLGGVTFLPASVISLAIILTTSSLETPWKNPDINIFQLIVCSISFLTIYLTGLLDDFSGLPYRQKFIAQITCGLLLASAGFRVDNFCGLLGIYEVEWYVSWPITVLAITYVINSLNLIDGIDGLASLLSIVTFILYGSFLIVRQSYTFSLICIVLTGVMCAFSYFNILGKSSSHTRIFMGDTGSMSIALIIAFIGLGIIGIDYGNTPSQLRMTIVLSPILIPCFDTIRVMWTRIKNKKNPFLPDCNHIHHRLLKVGLSQHKALLFIIFLDIVIIFANINLAAAVNINIIIIFDVLFYVILNLILEKRINRTKHSSSNLDI